MLITIHYPFVLQFLIFSASKQWSGAIKHLATRWKCQSFSVTQTDVREIKKKKKISTTTKPNAVYIDYNLKSFSRGGFNWVKIYLVTSICVCKLSSTKKRQPVTSGCWKSACDESHSHDCVSGPKLTVYCTFLTATQLIRLVRSNPTWVIRS